MKTILIAIAALLAFIRAQAVPVIYTYTGDFFTENHFQTAGGEIQLPLEEQPHGFRMTDRVTTTLIFDSAGWGFDEFSQNPFVLSTSLAIGPWGGGSWEIVRFLAGADGTVLRWGFFSIVGPRLDLAIGGDASGAGRDIIFGDGWSVDGIHGTAFVDYPAGSPSRWTFEIASVPDAGNTLWLLGISLAGIAFFTRRECRC